MNNYHIAERYVHHDGTEPHNILWVVIGGTIDGATCWWNICKSYISSRSIGSTWPICRVRGSCIKCPPYQPTCNEQSQKLVPFSLFITFCCPYLPGKPPPPTPHPPLPTLMFPCDVHREFVLIERSVAHTTYGPHWYSHLPHESYIEVRFDWSSTEPQSI